MTTSTRSRESAARRWLRQLRLHQWAKNLLIFVPAFVSHQILVPSVIWQAFLAFIWFGLTASATYVVNDLIDLEADRKHPRKRERPMASGEIPLSHGTACAVLLLSSALLGSALSLGGVFTSWLLLYLGGSLVYSLWVKRYAMIDVLWLGGLYALRVAAGAGAIDVVLSFWLLAFSVFIFLSLALAKRYTELRSVRTSGGSTAAGRGYDIDDLPLLLSAGTSSGLVSVLVFAFYINAGADPLYRNPEVLWFTCPLLLFWILRLWHITYRGELTDDPVVFACKDRVSLLVAFLCLLLTLLADWPAL